MRAHDKGELYDASREKCPCRTCSARPLQSTTKSMKNMFDAGATRFKIWVRDATVKPPLADQIIKLFDRHRLKLVLQTPCNKLTDACTITLVCARQNLGCLRRIKPTRSCLFAHGRFVLSTAHRPLAACAPPMGAYTRFPPPSSWPLCIG